GNKAKAQEFFESGLGKAFAQMREVHNRDYPLTVFYAFKQAESESEGIEDNESEYNSNHSMVTASTGWETMLEGSISSDFTVIGTWPIRTELANRTRGISSNALASSIILVCRPRPIDA